MSNHYDRLVRYSSCRRLNSPLSPHCLLSLYVSAINLSNLRLTVCLLYLWSSHINLQFIPTNHASTFCNLSWTALNMFLTVLNDPLTAHVPYNIQAHIVPDAQVNTLLSIYVPKLISISPLIPLTWNKFYMPVWLNIRMYRLYLNKVCLTGLYIYQQKNVGAHKFSGPINEN